jgi:hypothetical protein
MKHDEMQNLADQISQAHQAIADLQRMVLALQGDRFALVSLISTMRTLLETRRVLPDGQLSEAMQGILSAFTAMMDQSEAAKLQMESAIVTVEMATGTTEITPAPPRFRLIPGGKVE